MTISEHAETFFGKTVKDYSADEPVDSSPGIVYRLTQDYDDKGSMAELIEAFFARIDKAELEALVIGMWNESYETGPESILDTLVRHAASLPKLKAVFIGDMTYEECEISWINQGNYQPLLQAFPQLEALRIRGSTSLALPAFSHANLRQLVIECGGLPNAIAESLAQSSLPRLEHLELWLGSDDYGFDGDVAVYRRVLDQLRTPGLRYLGLRDSQIADGLAQWLAGEAWVLQLDTLDLSLGTLGDVGAEALYNSPHITKLKRLDLSHHYISAEWQDKLRSLGPWVVLDDPQEPDDEDRYVAVGE
jgi:hypothetical protein